jgi:hypothetical protein
VQVAQFIRSRGPDLSKKRVGEFVGSLDPFGQEVLKLLLLEYDFSGMPLDQALRVGERPRCGARGCGAQDLAGVDTRLPGPRESSVCGGGRRRKWGVLCLMVWARLYRC